MRLGTCLSFLALALVVFRPVPVQAWDDGGHMLVCEIAARRLLPETAARIAPLLPLLENRFNDGHPYNLITVGTWMDDMRKTPGYAWGKWHYINLPVKPAPVSDTVPFPDAPPPHVLWALDQALGLLRSPGHDDSQRAVALAQVIHFVGDLHQPLHVADRSDRGGTDFLIAPLTAAPHGPMQLHAFWDAAYRYAAPGGTITELFPPVSHAARPGGPSSPGVIAEQATALLLKHPPETLSALTAHPTVHDWAVESFLEGCNHGRPPVAPPANYEAVQLTPEFVAAANDIAQKRIILAGCRLAALLNELFGSRETQTRQR